MSYNKEKVKQFYENTLADYTSSLAVEDIATVNLVEKTDGKFTQIGIRPLVDEEMLIAPNFHPNLPGAGRFVAIGEEDFLIKSILDADGTERIEFKGDIKEFPKHVFDNAIILLSTKFYVEIFTKLMGRIDYEERGPRLDKRYKLIPISEKILENKIIIMGKGAILWDKEIFNNKITGKKEKIDIKIKPAPNGKVDITIRSVNKIKFIDKGSIKILEVKERNNSKN